MRPNSVRFTCTALNGTGKQGILPKDEDGYYTMPIGGLNVFNSMGELYTYQGAAELFQQSGSLMRRVKSGTLKGEYGHPKPDGPLDTEAKMNAFANRVMQVHEKTTSHHFSEVWLDFDNVKDPSGKPVIAIMAKVTPAGQMGPALARSFENKKEEVCFSIRAFTEDNKIRGINQRTLREIVTWDYVTEPGLDTARKWRSPALEGYQPLQSYQEASFTRENIESTVRSLNGMAMESGSVIGLNLLRAVGWDAASQAKPGYLNW